MHLVKYMPVIVPYEAKDGLLDEFTAHNPQQGRSRAVGLDYQSSVIDNAIAYRRVVIDVKVACTLYVKFSMRTAHLLILHFQFYLVHSQFIQSTLCSVRQTMLTLIIRVGLGLILTCDGLGTPVHCLRIDSQEHGHKLIPGVVFCQLQIVIFVVSTRRNLMRCLRVYLIQ